MSHAPRPLPSRALVRGWPLVGWTALAIAVLTALELAVAGTGESGIRLVVRTTARVSVVLFTLAFAAAPLRHRWRNPATAWLLANRRYVGVSFAVSHGTHLVALWALAGWSPARFVTEAGVTVTVLGGSGYLLLAAMTATSFDRTAAWLGPRRWKRLHTIGMYYLWVVFFISYAPRIAESPLYLPFAPALLGALALRWLGRRAGASGFAPEVTERT